MRTHTRRWRAYRFQGKNYLWLEEWQEFAKLSNDATELAAVEAAKREFARSGVQGAFRAAAAVQEREAKQHYIDPGWIAVYWSLGGEKDKAFSWLERGYQEKSGFMLHVKEAAPFDSLRSDERYVSLLKRMNLPQ